MCIRDSNRFLQPPGLKLTRGLDNSHSAPRRGKLRPTARPSAYSTGGADLLRGVNGRPVPFGAPFSALQALSADLAFAALTALPALSADLAFAASSALL